MNNKNIIIIGSTGKLGSKLLHHTFLNGIKIYAITCFNNKKKLINQKSKYNIPYAFVLSEDNDKLKFLNFLKKKIYIIYFLDYGSTSLIYLNKFLSHNQKSIIAIANKEMIIAGGNFLFKKIKKSKNIFIPLDSEHYSLKNNLKYSTDIKKVYITASGGPFFFSKKSNFKNVKLEEVLAHPKWKMGINNSIDSSNFINKILEIFELSYIYDIEISKIDFLISQNAYIHSIIIYNDGITSLNCYKNDMLLPLINPLTYLKNYSAPLIKDNLMYNTENLSISNNFDKRFNFFSFYKKMKKFNHKEQINFLLANNYAHSLYLSKKLDYVDIIPFIMRKTLDFETFKSDISFKSFKQILDYIDKFKKYLTK